MDSDIVQSITATPSALVERARALLSGPDRQILGLVGAPGAGKSTVAELIAAEIGPMARVVEMDGFHLSNTVLTSLGRRDRKGAADTFDVDGYVHLLRRLRHCEPGTVYAPSFDRALDVAVAGATAVDDSCRLVITAGNYLLSEEPPWNEVRGLLDQAWFLEPDEDQRVAQLVARHEQFGRTPEDAREWAHATDGPNAAVVRATKHRADLVVHLR
ncbi:MAG: nucleoside/nucleotide kinase family protein [Arachnia sp.]